MHCWYLVFITTVWATNYPSYMPMIFRYIICLTWNRLKQIINWLGLFTDRRQFLGKLSSVTDWLTGFVRSCSENLADQPQMFTVFLLDITCQMSVSFHLMFVFSCWFSWMKTNWNSIRKNLKTTNKKFNISTKVQPFWNVLKTFPNSCFVTRVVWLTQKGWADSLAMYRQC